MQYRHVKPLPLDGITVVTVGKETLAAINEGTCRSGPSPVVAELMDEFIQVLAASPGAVIIDIRDTQFIDHASMSVLFRLARLIADHGKSGIICCSSEVKELLDLCRVDTFCPTTSKLEKALAVLTGE